jgi:hypothetical protein
MAAWSYGLSKCTTSLAASLQSMQHGNECVPISAHASIELNFMIMTKSKYCRTKSRLRQCLGSGHGAGTIVRSAGAASKRTTE